MAQTLVNTTITVSPVRVCETDVRRVYWMYTPRKGWRPAVRHALYAVTRAISRLADRIDPWVA